MKPGPRSAQALMQTGTLPSHSICTSCRRSILLAQQHAASTAAAEAPQLHAAEPEAPVSSWSVDSTTKSPPPPVTGPKPYYNLNCSVVLSRPPILTRDLHPFESAFYLYQRRLNERLALPFTRYFYFKKDTPADIEWKRKARERITPARDIGRYHAYGKEAWNDELLLGAQESDREHQVQQLLNDAEETAEDPAAGGEQGREGIIGGTGAGTVQTRRKKTEIEKPLERSSKADGDGDQRSLNRLMARALYFLVQGSDGKWTFPTGGLIGREWFTKAAERILDETGGKNMNTWVVGNVPIGHYMQDYYQPTETHKEGLILLGQKTFFMKGRMMAGQADLHENKSGLKDFRWLSKEEIQKLVSPKYWSMTEDMLTER